MSAQPREHSRNSKCYTRVLAPRQLLREVQTLPVRQSVRPPYFHPCAVACEDWAFSSLPPNDVIPRDDRGEATYPSIYLCKLWLVERVLEQELSEGDLC